jgi:glutathione S-transferase
MIELWGRKNSLNVQKALWALTELGLDYSHYDVGSEASDLETSDFLAQNPHSKIPVIRDEGVSIWESHSIVRFLAAKYGSGFLWADSAIERSLADRWMDWAQTTLQPDFMLVFWGYYRTPAADRDMDRVANALERCRLHFRKLDEHLKHNLYLAGKSLTMGDIPCGAALYRYFEMGLEVEKPRYLLEWYQRLSSRESYRQSVMTSFLELKGRSQY